jgi:hypothetical protein
MLDFYLYLYYRSVKFYNGSSRGVTPIQVFGAFNIATLLILIYKLLILTGAIVPEEKPVLISMLITGACLIAAIPVIMILVWVYKSQIGKKFVEFDRDSPTDRKRKGKRIIMYFISSLLLLILSFLI